MACLGLVPRYECTKFLSPHTPTKISQIHVWTNINLPQHVSLLYSMLGKVTSSLTGRDPCDLTTTLLLLIVNRLALQSEQISSLFCHVFAMFCCRQQLLPCHIHSPGQGLHLCSGRRDPFIWLCRYFHNSYSHCSLIKKKNNKAHLLAFLLLTSKVEKINLMFQLPHTTTMCPKHNLNTFEIKHLDFNLFSSLGALNSN